MKSLIKLLTAIALAGVMGSASATALTFGINLTGNVIVDTGDIMLTTKTKLINPAGSVSGCTDLDPGACALAGIAAGDAAIFSTGLINTFVGPDAFTISLAGGLVFSFTVIDFAHITATAPGVPGSISLLFEGTVTSGGPAFLGQTVTLSQSCTQVKSKGAITCDESVITPGIPHEGPEPISLALVGMGLAAIGFIRRKRA